MSQSILERARLGAVRTRVRGLANTLRMVRAHDYLIRYHSGKKLLNLVKVKLARLVRSEKSWGMPYRFHIDPINVCNLRCPVCPTGRGSLGRAPGKIDIDDYRGLLNQIGPYAYVLELFEWGEPFLHPQIFELVGLAHAHGVSVRLSSNLNHFSAEMAAQTVESGLDRLVVSVDGATQTTYAAYRVGGDIDRVFEHVALLVDAKRRAGRRRPYITIRMLVHRSNAHEIGALRARAATVGADTFATGEFYVDPTDEALVDTWAPRDPRFTSYDWSGGPIENRWHCADLWEAMHIAWDGGAAPCCWTHKKANDLANVFTGTVEGIWNGPEYVSSRRVFSLRGERGGPVETVCTHCRGRPEYLQI